MVEIVSGLRAGLSLASGEVLGFKDVVGGPQQGRNGQEVAVNIATGQLVVQDRDDLLVGRGQDASVLRTFDARGNLRDMADARVHVVMDYDAVGNRTHVGTYVDYQGTGGETAGGGHRYYRYDAMNRQVVIDAADAAGNLGAQGHGVTYDRNGNRTSDTYWGPKVVSTTGPVITGYNEDGSAVYGIGATGFAAATGWSTEAYKYDALNRLWSVEKDGVQIDLRFYDGADRVMQSGPGGTLPQKYADLMNQGLAPDQMNGKEGRINRYDANGRLLHQRVLKSDNSAKLDISWDTHESEQGYVADGYDAAGNVVGYTVTNHDAGVVNEYTLTTRRFEGYQSAVTRGVSSRQLPGDSTQQYDANGFLVAVVDSTQAANNRTLVNDSAGHALFVNQGGNIQRQLVVNGEVIGTYGVGVDPNNPASGANNNPNFANVVDFDFGYAPVSASYPSASPGAYTVRTGDTLQSIARAAYGDSSLWFRIADANGLASSNDLKVGQTLNIPNRVGTISNNAETFKPYDPSRIEGDKTPSLATPVPKKRHNWLAQLVQVVVAVVVAIFAPEMLGITQGFWAGVAAGALGSAAGQLAGIALGTQSSFDWKGVALGAIGGGLGSAFHGTAPLGGAVSSSANVAARAVLANALTQGVGVVMGLQRSFDWRSVAGAAAGAVAGAAFEPGVEGSESAARYDDEGNLIPGAGPREGIRFYSSEATNSMSFRAARSLSTAMSTAARGLASAVGGGGRVGFEEIAVDAFGNALGESLAPGSSSAGAPAQATPFPDRMRTGAELPDMAGIAALNAQITAGKAADDYEGVDVASLNGGFDLSSGASVPAVAGAGLKPGGGLGLRVPSNLLAVEPGDDQGPPMLDSMGQPLNGPSSYNAFSKFGEIAGGFRNDLRGTLGKLGDWLTYTVPDAQQKAAEINARYGMTQDPFLQRIDKMEASPLGAIFSLGSRAVGGGQAAQDALLNIGTAADGLGLALAGLTGRSPAFTGAQRPATFDTLSRYPVTSMDYLAGRTSFDKMQMGIQFESVQGTLNTYALYQGRTATQVYMRAFDANGELLRGSVRMDMVGLRSDGLYELIDYKLSSNSPLTANQGLHYPAFARYGGLVTGLRARDIGAPRGTILPPTAVKTQPGPLPYIPMGK